MCTNNIRKIIVVTIICLLISTILIPIVSSDTPNSKRIIYVDDDAVPPYNGTILYPYKTIQDGVNNSNDGDTIYVLNGTYFEKINISKPITLIGENINTSINGDSNQNYVISIAVDGVTIQGFIIRNIGGHWKSDNGIIITSNNSNIKENIITNFDYGITMSQSNHNRIEKNSIIDNEHGLKVLSSSFISVIDNSFVENKYGIRISESDNCDFQYNVVDGNKFAINIWKSKYTDISNNLIKNNSNGINIEEYSSYSIIQKNNFTSNGWAVDCDVTDNILITYNSFNYNFGSISVYTGILISIFRNKFINDDHGGILLIYSLFINIYENNFFIDNSEYTYFLNSFKINWNRNYWGDKDRWGPYLIKGEIEIPWFGDIWNPNVLGPFKWFDFDIIPAKKPFNIPMFEVS